MIIYNIFSSWAVIVYLLIGIFVFRASPKSTLNSLYLLLNLSLAWWSYSYIFLYAASGDEARQIWSGISSIGWSLQPAIALNFVLVLVKKEKILNYIWAYPAIYLPGIFFSAFELFLIYPISKYSVFLYNFLFISEYVYLFGYSALSIRIIWLWQKDTVLLREKKQAKIIAISGLVTLILSFANQMQVYIARINIFPDITHLIMLILMISFWYAIIKYRLMDIKSLVSADDIVDKVTDIIFLIDVYGNIRTLNHRAEKVLDYNKNELAGRHISEIIQKWEEAMADGISSTDNFEGDSGLECMTKEGRSIPISIYVSEVKDSAGETVGSLVICRDIRLIKKLKAEIAKRELEEQKLFYLSRHDSLTGLYNRRHFEDQLQRLSIEESTSIAVVICDVDGLKIVNDTLGHEAGDSLLKAAADIIRDAFGSYGDVFRIGGDEFAVLIPNPEIDHIRRADSLINTTVERYNAHNEGFLISISIGYAISKDGANRPYNTFKEADNNMYREKLSHIKSVRSSMVQALMKMLEARDFITEGHADRMKDLVVELGQYLGLPEQKINDLRLLAQFHDIGKVGIPDKVLFKQGRLTEAEKLEMQMHSEIGFRIAESIPDLSSIAELILKHHERWDGKGYPLRMKGVSIPLECRILSIVDAFDAMTNDRPYRKAMSETDAIVELEKNAGVQFDPHLVTKFIELLEKGSKPIAN